MNLDKKQLFPKVASSPVFLPAEFWVYSYYILWARRGDAKVGEFGFPENVFVSDGYSNSSLYFIRIEGPNEPIFSIKNVEW